MLLTILNSLILKIMKTNKEIKPGSEDQVKKASNDAIKNISELGKLELERKKKVDPGVE